jgi:PAS domain S-box-containing protein
MDVSDRQGDGAGPGVGADWEAGGDGYLAARAHSTFEGIAITSAGRILMVNPQFAEMTGYRAEDLIGKAVLDLVHPEDRAFIAGRLDLIDPAPCEHRMVRADGSTIMVSVRSRNFDHGTKPWRVTVLRDVTAERAAAEALAGSETRFRALFDNAGIGIAVVGFDGRFQETNAALQAMLGRSAAELTALTVDDVSYPGEPANDYSEAVRLRAGEVGRYQLVKRYVRSDGEVLWVRVTVTALRDAHGTHVANLGMVEDITAQRHAEEALARTAALEATTSLAAGIAHDFNNLMMAVMGNAELLGSDVAGNAEAQVLVDDILQSSARAAELAQQMLSFARAGRYHPRRQCLAALIQRRLADPHTPPPARLSVVCEVPADLPPIELDEEQFAQVLSNLLHNAAEATGGAGTVRLNAAVETVGPDSLVAAQGVPPGTWLALSVADDGEGMTPEVRRRAFEPFFSTRFLGRGLGLAAVWGIVANHGGHITVDSAPGEGATVRLYLPPAG